MKTNEAPEKLYLLPMGIISYCKNTDEDVEYVRTDAFVEKACEWLKDRVDIPCNVETNEKGEPYADSYIDYTLNRLEAANKIIDDFKNAMKG